MDQEMAITQARRKLAEIVRRARYEGSGTVILRRGRPAAAVVPIEVYRRWKREREALFEVIGNVQAANKSADPDQVMNDVLEAQQVVRRSVVES